MTSELTNGAFETRLAVATPPGNGGDTGFAAGASHNNYALYVTNENDLIGLVAYSLYKQHKIAFLASELSRTGRPALPEKVETFCSMYAAPHQVALLKSRANTLLEGMNEVLLASTVTQLNKQFDSRLVKELKQGPGFWRAVRDSVAGNFATALITVVVLFGISVSDRGLIPAFVNLLGGEIKAK